MRRRKVVQWGIFYAAGAWGFLQGLEYISESFDWPGQLRQIAILALLTRSITSSEALMSPRAPATSSSGRSCCRPSIRSVARRDSGRWSSG